MSVNTKPDEAEKFLFFFFFKDLTRSAKWSFGRKLFQ